MADAINEGPPEDLTREQLVSMYRRMRLIRGFEDRAQKLFEAGELGGFLHLSQGQEAGPVGTCAALRLDDYITSTHRGHSDIISKGCEQREGLNAIFRGAGHVAHGSIYVVCVHFIRNRGNN